MAYVVSLKQFEGPLDLLLHLINRAKVDIRDIFVSEITEQYLASMTGIDELDMDSASEFIEMAAALLEIKSRMLLPKPVIAPQDAESPEDVLIRRLTEYKAFKEASRDMEKLEEAARLMLTKLPEEFFPLPPPTVELTGLTLSALNRAFLRMLEKAKQGDDAPSAREIQRDAFTMRGCILRILAKVKIGSVRFIDLFEPGGRITKEEVVTVFLALLELLRMGQITVHQEKTYDDIFIESAKTGAAD